MVKKIIMCVLTIVSAQSVCADTKLAFIDAQLDDFVTRFVMQDSAGKADFKAFFSKLNQQLQAVKQQNTKKEKATYRYLYSLALERLAAKHAEWHQELLPYISEPVYTLNDDLDEVRTTIKLFLTRYGAYEEYLDFQIKKQVKRAPIAVAQNNGFFETVKSYFNTATSKVAGFFRFGSKGNPVA